MSGVRLHAAIRGAVQGIGFRPFIYRIAVARRLRGYVMNTPGGVIVEAEGPRRALDSFLKAIEAERPPLSHIESLETTFLDAAGFGGFEIRASGDEEAAAAFIMPDIAVCPACLAEIFDRKNRRFRYPFTNCTHCGPRWTIVESLPYDRARTTMKGFAMCPACDREYRHPLDRRFHAQPNACPACGPRLALVDREGGSIAEREDALQGAAHALRDGAIVAVKGVGGFHLMADARDGKLIRTLRERKAREEKPFAVMVPDFAAAERACRIDRAAGRLLLSPESPIVLLPRRRGAHAIAAEAAPGNPNLGLMLPSTPLHHLLMREIGFPVVATSGNLSGEPLCTGNEEAVGRLGPIADLLLVHDRPIARPVDDSVVRIAAGRELVLRRARGYAPLPVDLGRTLPAPVVAVGGHLKNTVALAAGSHVFISQHLGDLESPAAFELFRRTIATLKTIYRTKPAAIAADMHPGYRSTGYALGEKCPAHLVQHHYAHVASCMAENRLDGALLGIAWDGTGYGPDGTVWGGEFLVTHDSGFTRFAALKPFRLPGGEQAIHEPRRSAVGLLYELFNKELFDRTSLHPVAACSQAERILFRQMLARNVNAPLTTSAGRLFDAVASLLGIRQTASFEGQAAMELEFAARPARQAYPFTLNGRTGLAAGEEKLISVDWLSMLLAILDDIAEGVDRGIIAGRFHATLVEMMIAVAKRAGLERVVLSGGCFQNVLLLETAIRRLKEEGFQPYWHQRVPPNDGGLALGQIAALARAAAAAGELQPVAEPAFLGRD